MNRIVAFLFLTLNVPLCSMIEDPKAEKRSLISANGFGLTFNAQDTEENPAVYGVFPIMDTAGKKKFCVQRTIKNVGEVVTSFKSILYKEFNHSRDCVEKYDPYYLAVSRDNSVVVLSFDASISQKKWPRAAHKKILWSMIKKANTEDKDFCMVTNAAQINGIFENFPNPEEFAHLDLYHSGVAISNDGNTISFIAPHKEKSDETCSYDVLTFGYSDSKWNLVSRKTTTFDEKELLQEFVFNEDQNELFLYHAKEDSEPGDYNLSTFDYK